MGCKRKKLAVETQVPFAEAVKRIRSGDVLLFRIANSFASVGIGAVTGSEYSHAEMAYWLSDENFRELCSVGMYATEGGRLIGLRKLVAARSIDVYRVRSTVKQRSVAVTAMLNLLNEDYNVEAIKKMWNLFGIFRFITHFFKKKEVEEARNDTADNSLGPKECSQGVGWAWRTAGIDFVKNRADFATSPGHIAESPLTTYQFTITL